MKTLPSRHKFEYETWQKKAKVPNYREQKPDNIFDPFCVYQTNTQIKASAQKVEF